MMSSKEAKHCGMICGELRTPKLIPDFLLCLKLNPNGCEETDGETY